MMLIRKAIDADVPAILHLIEKATRNGKILKRSSDDIRRNLAGFLVAEQEGAVIGCCALEIYNQKLAEVRSLAVAQERQRKGVASALISASVAAAEKRGVFEVLAITDRLNLFKRHGFSEQLHGQKALFLRPSAPRRGGRLV
ncbi:MAG: GNAT family N-acetyltransferase [Elusimicrobia bacterium]|nr:GNAT family N-acetyltransferase [Elusimicrobiota bacterium]